MADKPETVQVEALKWHTHAGKSYDVGDTYDAPADLVDSLAVQGMAVRVDRAAVAKTQAREAEKAAKARTTAVSPMTIDTKSAKRVGKARLAKKVTGRAKK